MTETVAMFLMLMVVGVLNTVQPNLTRPELFFSVTVMGDFRRSSTARRIIRLYVWIGWTGTLAAALLLFSGFVPPFVGLVATVLGWMAAYFVARRRSQPHRTEPTSIRETLLSMDLERFPGGLLAAAGPLILLAAKTVYVYLHWEKIPSRFPVHWGFNGPDRWVDRSFATVYGSLATVTAMCAVIVFSAYATIRASRKISAMGPAAESEQKYRSASAICLLALAYAFAIFLPPIEGGTIPIPFTPVVFLLISVVFIAMLVWYGQGGTRIVGYESAEGPPVGDRTSDDRWKLGMFYYNPDDPAVMVEKRFGIGWTLNFGNRLTWMIVPLLVLPLVFSLIMR